MQRPKLKNDPEAVMEYLNWYAEAGGAKMVPVDQSLHHHVSELAVRVLTTVAQGKATQHTLVEQGLIDQPGQ